MGEVYDVYYTTAGNLHYCDTERGGKDIVVQRGEEQKMEQVELAIKIPKEYYDLLMSGRFYLCGARGNGKTVTSEVMKSICTGTVLPKGHGRLKDFDKIEWYGCDFEGKGCIEANGDCSVCNHANCYAKQVRELPTIIEADTEGAEE